MGMYTTVVCSSVEITDDKGLRAWLKTKKVPYYVKAQGTHEAGKENESIKNEYAWWKTELLKHVETSKYFEISDILNERKIIGYWYAGFLYFIRDLAQFVEGEVELVYEDGQSFAKLVFQDKECLVRYGEINYTDPEPLDISPLPEHEQLQRRL